MDRKNQAYEYVKNSILNGDLPQGAPVKELELAATLNMSRTPIREALRQLEAEGVVVSYPSRGTFVTTITPYDVEEIFELRILLETWALEKGFYRITDEELNQAEAAFTQSYEPFQWETYHIADRAFHHMILDKAGNKRLSVFASTLDIQIERIRRFGAKEATRREHSYSEHMNIIKCMRNRDLLGSRLALQNHLRSVADSAIETCKIMEYSPYRAESIPL